MQQYFENALIEHCAPTLAGMKPASLFRMNGIDVVSVRRLAEIWDQRLRPFGVRLLVLKECTDACMIYIYRERELKRILQDDDNRQFLQQFGYGEPGLADTLSRLSRRLCFERDFPHEIGVFLGYPLTDVIGFIENQGRNYTCSGCWKSYGDPEAAKRCFARYHACTSVYKRMYGRGTPIIQLVVAA